MYDTAEPPKTKATSKGVNSDSDKKEVESCVGIGSVKGYRPTSSRHSKVRNNEKVHPRAESQPQVSQEKQPPSPEVKGNSFLPVPTWMGSDYTSDDDSWHHDEVKEKESQAASQELKKPVKKNRKTSRDSSECLPGSRPRRSSDSLASSSHSGKRLTMRKLSEPMHRCSHTNAGVNGIMRPARYSSNNLSGMVATSSPSTLPSNGRIRKSTSVLALNTHSTLSLSKSASSQKLSNDFSRSSFDLQRSSKPRRTMSIADMANANWNSHPTPVDQKAKDEWVASGVAFSKNMEVYVFKK